MLCLWKNTLEMKCIESEAVKRRVLSKRDDATRHLQTLVTASKASYMRTSIYWITILSFKLWTSQRLLSSWTHTSRQCWNRLLLLMHLVVSFYQSIMSTSQRAGQSISLLWTTTECCIQRRKADAVQNGSRNAEHRSIAIVLDLITYSLSWVLSFFDKQSLWSKRGKLLSVGIDRRYLPATKKTLYRNVNCRWYLKEPLKCPGILCKLVRPPS